MTKYVFIVSKGKQTRELSVVSASHMIYDALRHILQQNPEYLEWTVVSGKALQGNRSGPDSKF